MILLRRIFFLASVSCLVALTSQCAPRAAQQESSPRVVRAETPPEGGRETNEATPFETVQRRYTEILAADIPPEISRLLSSIRTEHGSTYIMMTHLQLAWLYGHYRNPSPQYLKAQQELEAYMVLDPKNSAHDYLQNWYRMLKEMGRLHRENSDLRGKADQLREQVEQLKYLDIEMEKRRQNIK
jgi:hypothetical protein